MSAPHNYNAENLTQQRRNSMAAPQAVDPGIYLGRVANNLDPHRMGFCEVEIISNSRAGSTAGSRGEVIVARYTSPFAGQSSYATTGESSLYEESQNSYGMWMVPPDVGIQCLVCVTEGGEGEAFILSYMWDMYANQNMFNNMEASYNKKTVDAWESVVDKHARGKNNKVPTWFNLKTRDQLEDFAGVREHLELSTTVTSGARRDTPSQVYGISTPGHFAHWGPKSRRIYTQNVGEDAQEFFKMRVGGHSIIMDDGMPGFTRKSPPWWGHRDYEGTPPWNVNLDPDESPQIGTPTNSGENKGYYLDAYLHEHMRIQTRTGHRIIMHNSEDFIHIMHGNGMSWINMSSNGKIDVFAKDGVHIGSQSLDGSKEIDGQSQINLHGHQVNIDADEINFSAMRKIYMEQRKDLGFGKDEKHRGRGEIQFALEVVDGRLEIVTSNGFGISTFEGDPKVWSDNIKNGNLKFHMFNRGDNFVAKSFPLDIPSDGLSAPIGSLVDDPIAQEQGFGEGEATRKEISGTRTEGIGIGYAYQEVAEGGPMLFQDLPGPFLELVGTHRSGNASGDLEEGDLVLKAVLATNPPHEIAHQWNIVSGMGENYWTTKPIKKYEIADGGLVNFYKDPEFTVIKTNLGRLPSGYPWKHEELNEPFKMTPPQTTWGKNPDHDLDYSGLELTEANFAIPPEGYQSANHVDCREYSVKGRRIL